MSYSPSIRTLRPKKSINYLEIVMNKSPRKSDVNSTAVDESSDSDEEFHPMSDCNSSGSELFSKIKKPKLSDPVDRSLDLIFAENELDLDDENEYKLQRQKKMANRLNILKTIDYEDDVNKLKTIKSTPKPTKTPKVLQKIPRSTVPRRKQPTRVSDIGTRRQSVRLMNKTPDGNEHESQNSQTLSVESESTVEKTIEDNLNLVSYEDDEEFLEKLKQDLNVPYNSISDFTSCDSQKFTETLKSCHMFEEPVKVITSRIVALDFHPSEEKLLVLCGDKNGHVGIWDLLLNRGIMLRAHDYNTNCVSFSKRDSTKFYSTSLDGTTREGDINNNSFKLLYSNLGEDSDRESHTTWHHELGQTLFVAKGDGVVTLVDLRSSSDNHPSYQCHKRSVRTVQSHPANDNYFLTSSGTGVFGIWDLRSIKARNSEAVILEDLGRSLTSAFYSCTGSSVLTTSNDDTIRIYDCRNDKSKMLVKIPHSNHTGRWLSVIKAKWQPQREDYFYTGSMLQNPKRIQAYNANGEVIHDLSSPMMETYCPVVTIHPTKPIIVGGNGSGKLHVFSPLQNLSEI